MKFKSVNETENFIYKDCVINEAHFTDVAVSFIVEALIVKASNSQNTNYTNSYAGDTEITFIRSVIEKITLLGYNKYDANDNLLEKVEDKEVSMSLNEMKTKFTGAYLTEIICEEEKYKVYFEIPDEDPSAVTDEYEMIITCDEVVIEWDKYLNRVQEM